MACRFGIKPLSEQMLAYCQPDPSVKFESNTTIFFKENEFENVVCKMTIILSLHQCVRYNTENRYVSLILWIKRLYAYPGHNCIELGYICMCDGRDQLHHHRRHGLYSTGHRDMKRTGRQWSDGSWCPQSWNRDGIRHCKAEYDHS